MYKKYKISQKTIKSIVDRVPKESWAKCFEEMSQVFLNYANIIKENNGQVEFDKTIFKPIIWVDDNLREITFKNDKVFKMEKSNV